jgi:hypothetical protein
MWNSFGTPEVFCTKIARLGEQYQRVGRDPATIEKSVLVSGTFALDHARRQVDAYAAVSVTHIVFSIGHAGPNWITRVDFSTFTRSDFAGQVRRSDDISTGVAKLGCANPETRD